MMKNICLIQPDLSILTGGVRVTSLLANELSKRYNVFVVSIIAYNGKCLCEISPNISCDILLLSKKRMRYLLATGILELRKYFLRNSIDVAISVGAGANLFLVGSSFHTCVKTIFCEHSSLSNEFDCSMGQSICRWVGAKYADKIITLTKSDMENYIETYLLNKEKVDYIYNFIESKLLQDRPYNEKSKIILSVGRFDRIKGYDMLIEVAKKVFVECKDWQWHIYGDGDKSYIKEIQELIVQNHLENFVFIKGVSNNIYSIYHQAGIFVLTSYYEGLPMVLLEAKANNLPLVSFDCKTGPSEIIEDGISGSLVVPYDIDTMAKKICLLIENRALRKTFSMNAKNNMGKFEKKIIIDKWMRLIDHI